MNARRLVPLAVLSFAALAPAAGAQVQLQSDPFAFSGSANHRNCVRDAEGTLYVLAIRQTATGDREVVVHVSSDGGLSFAVDPFRFNDASSGLVGPDNTTSCALAIDSEGRLHATWGNYHYPSYYRQFYRQYHPGTGASSPIVDVTAITGATTTARTSAMNVIVDAADTVWLVGHGISSWASELLHSATPFASSLAFTNVGRISPSLSAQNARLAVDAVGRVHCTYYRNIGTGDYEHRIYDPSTGWGASTLLGNATAPNDHYGSIAADSLGNVHLLFSKDATSGSSLWQLRYRRWDSGSGWSSEVSLMDATSADHLGVANDRFYSLACDEVTGRVFALYRDLAGGGALRLAEKGLADAGFTNTKELQPAASGNHAYFAPSVRGTLYPAFNNTGGEVHVTWQHRAIHGSPPYELFFENASLPLSASPTVVSLATGGVQTFTLTAGPTWASLPYLLLGTTGGTSPGTPIDSIHIPLNVDAYTVWTLHNPNTAPLDGSFGNLDASGRASATLTVPTGLSASLAGTTLHHAYVVIELIPNVLLHMPFASNDVPLTLIP